MVPPFISQKFSNKICFLFLCVCFQLVLANPGGNVMEKLHESNALEGFGLNGIYLTVSEAVADISSLWKTETELPI